MSLAASNLTSGTLNNARLPSTVDVTSLRQGGVTACLDNGAQCSFIVATGAGTWTPTYSNSGNASSITNQGSRYSRVASTVTGSMAITYTVASAGTSNFQMTLPISSNFASQYDATGTCVIYTASNVKPVALLAAASTSRMSFSFAAAASDIGATQLFCTYSYTII